MAQDPSFENEPSELRRRAEELLGQRPEDIEAIPGDDIQRLIHELRVHQIELEMQNEELRKTQGEINELLTKYFDLYELAPVGYLVIDKKGLILEANLTGANLLGVQMRYLIKKRFSRFVEPDSQDRFYFHRKQVLQTGAKQICELRLVKKDGTPFHAQLDSMAVQDGEGNSNQFRTAITDITERKQAEEALQESYDGLERRVEERTAELLQVNQQLTREVKERKRAEEVLSESEEEYRLLVQNLPAIVYRGFKDWTVQFFDEKVGLLTGYSIGEFNSKGIKWSDIIVEEDLETAKQDFIEALKTDKSYVREYRIRTKEGDVLWIQDRGQIICNHHSEIEYVSGVFFDITNRKETEGKLLTYQQQLRSLASELTLSEERERRRLAANLHDSIIQLLAISKMKLGVLQGSTPSATLTGELGGIHELVGQALEQTRTLTFELSPPELHAFGLGAALGNLTRRMEKLHSIRFEYVDADQTTELDEDLKVLLFRAVQELLLNVVKHAHAQNIRVSLSSEDKQLLIKVEDDGVGFDIPQEGHHLTDSRGFGLFSISERLRHVGGRLEIDSSHGQGTQVSLTVPLKGKKENTRGG
jgi:PAS domain S-box-containing protein